MPEIFSTFSKEQLFIASTEWCFSCSAYLFMKAFFNTKECKNKFIEFLSYFVATIIIAFQYLLFNYMIVNIILNFLILFLLSLNYKGSVKKRIVIAIVFYITNSLVEITIVGLNSTAYLFSPPTVSINISDVLLVRIIELFIADLVNKLKYLQNGEKLPKYYWISICLILITNLFLAIILTKSNLTILYFTIASFLLLCEDVIIIFLLDRIGLIQKQSKQIIISDLQNESYKKQLEIINGSLLATKVMRHDMKNQMLAVQGLLENKNYNSALEHVKSMTGTWATVSKNINTGNVEADSLLNFKISQAEQEHIKVTTNISIPEHLLMRSFDLATILGNLFDNSFDALKKLSDEKRKLLLTIKYSKGRIFISFENPYTGIISWKNGIPCTQKSHKEFHGVGLQEVNSTVARYNGQMFFSTENNLFKVTVMIYESLNE